MPKIRPHLTLLGFLVLVCLAGLEAATGQTKPAPAYTQIDLSTYGYSGLSPLNRFTERFNLSLNFVDSDHLLFTFNAHNSRALLVRQPGCAPSSPCHMVHAVVIDLRNNKVTAATDWELYDYQRYLWPLGNGNFLLRRSNSIFLAGADLQEKLLYSSPDELLWSGITADRKQLILESRVPGSANAEPHDQNQGKVKIEFRDVNSLEIRRTLRAPQVSEMKPLSSGYADSVHNPVRQTWLIRFGESEDKRKDLMQVRSPCRPNLLFPTDKTLFVGRCSPDSTTYNVSVFTLSGHPLWRQKWNQIQYYPAILGSDDGSRIVVSTVTPNRDEQASPSSDDAALWPDVEQDIRVLEAATGNEILKTETKTAILNSENYSLSADGHRFALVDGTVLYLYDLPPMTTEERARYVEMDADSLDLAAPVTSSADEAGQDSSGPDSQAAEGAPGSDLAAPVRTENRAPMEIPNVSDQGAKPGGSDSSGVNSQDAGQAQNLPTFTVGTEEVTVDVVVTDSKGHAVKNLSKDDFQVQENGQPQELASFREYGDSPAEPSKPVASAPPPPNVFNNNHDTALPAQPMVVILLDFLNTELADQQDAIQQLAKFLRTKPAGTKFALFLLTERLQMLQGFTTDENLLLATLGSKSARPRISSELQKMDLGSIIEGYRQQAQYDPAMERDVQELTNSQASLDATQLDRRAIVTTDGFAALANYLNATPGRKSLIWLSGSFPLSFVANANANVDTANLTPVQNSYSGLVRKTTNLLAESHIAVYPVNVRGLVVNVLPGVDENPDSSVSTLPGSSAPAIAHVSTGGTNQASSMAAPSALDQRMDEQRQDRLTANTAMDQVASETGGKAFQNANDLTQAMQTAAELSSHYYLLSYSPKKQAHDGTFRSIKVLLARKGLRVAHRRGYYAVDQQAASAKSDLKIAMNSAAMEQGLPQARQMVFAARVVPVGKLYKTANSSSAGTSGAKEPTVEMQRYSVDYAIAASELRFRAKDKGHAADLILMAVVYGEKGAVLSQIAFESATTLNSAAYKDAQIGGLRMHQEFEVPASGISLRLGIVDVLSGHLGTLELPLPLTAPPEEVRLAKRHLPPVEPN
jgi:VWFA-related protein